MNIGYRDVNVDPSDGIRFRMSVSPTGRQLAVDGTFVLPLVDFDPNTANATQIWPDGSTVIYVRAGTKEVWTYDRLDGWQQV